jgi:type VI protein secretion system component VasK
MTFDLLQILIAVFGISAMVFLAFSRVLAGCVLNLVAYGVWAHVAYEAGQPGALVLALAMFLICVLGVLGRIPRHRPANDDETEMQQKWSQRAELKAGTVVRNPDARVKVQAE